MEAVPWSDPGRVRVHGPGLVQAHTDKDAIFTVDCSDAGHGIPSVKSSGPSEVIVTCSESSVGVYTAKYKAVTKGNYSIAITFAEQPITGHFLQYKAK